MPSKELVNQTAPSTTLDVLHPSACWWCNTSSAAEGAVWFMHETNWRMDCWRGRMSMRSLTIYNFFLLHYNIVYCSTMHQGIIGTLRSSNIVLYSAGLVHYMWYILSLPHPRVWFTYKEGASEASAPTFATIVLAKTVGGAYLRPTHSKKLWSLLPTNYFMSR